MGLLQQRNASRRLPLLHQGDARIRGRRTLLHVFWKPTKSQVSPECDIIRTSRRLPPSGSSKGISALGSLVGRYDRSGIPGCFDNDPSCQPSHLTAHQNLGNGRRAASNRQLSSCERGILLLLLGGMMHPAIKFEQVCGACAVVRDDSCTEPLIWCIELFQKLAPVFMADAARVRLTNGGAPELTATGSAAWVRKSSILWTHSDRGNP